MTEEEKQAISELENLAEYGLCYNITEDTQEKFKTILKQKEKQDNRINELEKALEEKDKIIEDMAEWIYSNISLCKMSKIGMSIGYNVEKFILGMSDEEAKRIIKRYFEKKEG